MHRMPLELGIKTSPGVTGWNRLQDRFWKSKSLRLRLAQRLDELLVKEFTLEKLTPTIDGWAAEIKSGAAHDHAIWGGDSQLNLDGGIRDIKTFIRQRSEFVRSRLAQLRE